MILCITPNPAVDRTILLPHLVVGNVHRAQKVLVAAGGKGLNVARTIRTLGGEYLCMGFAGGYNGRLLENLAQTEGLRASWTWMGLETRTCTILVSPEGDATVINEPGMPISAVDWKRLQENVGQQLLAVDRVCISGSLPPHSRAEDLQELLNLLVEADKQVWLDTSGMALQTALAHPEICIKVNGGEIREALGFEASDIASTKRALLAVGVHTASIITLGSAGALLATQEGRWHAQGPPVSVVSTVGSGDSFLGGLVSALDAGEDWPEALRNAVAAGTANALSAGGGQFGMQEFAEIRKQVRVETW